MFKRGYNLAVTVTLKRDNCSAAFKAAHVQISY